MSRGLLTLLAGVTTSLLLCASPALAKPGLEPSPAQVSFGAVDIHFGGNPHQTLQLYNRSPSGSVAIGSLVLEGPGAESFALIDDSCSGQILGPMTSCSVEIDLHVSARGPAEATLAVPTGEETVEVPLSGEGVTGTLAANPSPLRFQPIPYTSGGEHEGEDNETEQINVEDLNAGTEVGSVTISGPGAASYSIQYGSCEGDLMASGNTCDEGIRFQPTEQGMQRATLTIAGDSSEPALQIPLEGEGLLGPVAQINTTQALLGDVEVGSTVEQTFSVANTGDYPLYIQQDFLVSGTPLMFKVLSDSCAGHAIPPGGSCELHVAFTPTTAGQKDAGILLITNATPPIKVLGIDATAVEGVATTPPTAAPAPRLRPLIAFKRPQLKSAPGSKLLETGIIALCPPGIARCEISTSLTMQASATEGSSRVRGDEPLVLGGRRRTLRQGQNARLLVRLDDRALKLLRRYGHIRVMLTTVMTDGGRVLDRQSRQVVLSSRD